MGYVRTELPDGCYCELYHNGDEYWYNRDGELHRVGEPALRHRWFTGYLQNGEYHRLDGPAVIWNDKTVSYFVNGEIPFSILDVVIIGEEMDYEMFPSAKPISNYNGGYRNAYRIHNPDELVLAILRYS